MKLEDKIMIVPSKLQICPYEWETIKDLWNVFGSNIEKSEIEIEKWLLENAWVQSADFGDLSYEDDGLMDVQITLRYFRAIANY